MNLVNITRIKYCLIVIIPVVMMIAGCEKPPGISIPESKWKQGQGDLSDTIGSGDYSYNFRTPDEPISLPLNSSLEKTEYDKPTEKWFGKIGYGIPLGTMRAGEVYTVSLFGHEKNGTVINRDIRMQLTKRKDFYKKKELITKDTVHVDTVKGEETIYISDLPHVENTSYLFSMEVLDVNGKVEDTLVGFIYVPKLEMNAEMRMDQDVYSQSDDEATLTLENSGPTILSFGEGYVIEKKVNDSWKTVPLNYDHIDIGIYMDPGDHYEWTIGIAQLDSGHYRTVKTFSAGGLDLTATLAAEFKIN